MMRWMLPVVAAVICLTGCGPSAADRVVGTWLGQPAEINPALQLLAPQLFKLEVTFNRDGTGSMTGQSGSWRVVAADATSTTIEISSTNAQSKTKLTQEWKLTWVDNDQFTTSHPDFPQAKLNFSRKK